MSCEMSVREHLWILMEAIGDSGLGGACKKEQAALETLVLVGQKIHGAILPGDIDDPEFDMEKLSDEVVEGVLQYRKEKEKKR